MSYLTFQDSYIYFKSIANYGTITPTSDAQYDIKFIYEIKLARLIYKALLVRFPQYKTKFTFYKTLAGDKVVIGGRFPNEVNMRKIIFDLKDTIK